MDELKRKREALVTRSFYLAFEILAIFGLPALGAVALGSFLAGEGDMRNGVTYALLAGAFVLSWVIFLWRVRTVSRALTAIQDEIKEEKARDKGPSRS